MTRNLMLVHGLPATGPGAWAFKWSSAKKQAGSCDSRRRIIRISRPIAELWGADGIRDTVLHEIAHAIAGYKAAHGPAWREACLRIGAKPERCYMVTDPALLPAMRYTGTCPAGHTTQGARLPKRKVSCHVCAPRYDERYVFTWTAN